MKNSNKKILLTIFIISLISSLAFEILCCYFGTANVFYVCVCIATVVGLVIVPFLQLRKILFDK